MLISQPDPCLFLAGGVLSRDWIDSRSAAMNKDETAISTSVAMPNTAVGGYRSTVRAQWVALIAVGTLAGAALGVSLFVLLGTLDSLREELAATQEDLTLTQDALRGVGSTCRDGFFDCDGDIANGCETYVLSSNSHCGQCGNACGTASGAQSGFCDQGVCGTCVLPYADCNNNRVDGCEININSDVNNCGSCGAVCPEKPHTQKSCTNGICTYSCNPGFGDCDGNIFSNGCEKNLLADSNFCGTCTTACELAFDCEDGTCKSILDG